MLINLITSCIFAAFFLSHTSYGASGKFEGRVVTEWLNPVEEPDRKMKVLEEFKFVDENGYVWVVPIGAKIDGASIPRAFWITTGPPFVGDYRRASVVHDYFCETKEKPWKKVHRMFYEAMRADGVSLIKAVKMYAAVYAGGPRWKLTTIRDANGELLKAEYKPKPNVSKVLDFLNSEEIKHYSLDEIDNILDKKIELN